MNTINNEQFHTKDIQLQQLFEAYLSECEYIKQLRPQTLKSYKEVFSTFQKIMPEIVTINELHPFMMNTFFKRLKTRTRIIGKNTPVVGVKTSTIKTYYNKLMAFFRWLEHNNFIDQTLVSKIVKPPNPVYVDERALSQAEVSKIIASISLHGTDDFFGYKRDLLIISIFIYTGVRRQELLSLRIQDVKFEERMLFINGKTSKSKTSRYIPLHPILISQLKSYLTERRKRQSHCDALIVSCRKDSPFTKHGLKHWVNRYRKFSGIRFHVHQLRHTFACSLAKTNADITTIMRALGHTNIRTTQGYLRSITTEHSRSYIEQLSF